MLFKVKIWVLGLLNLLKGNSGEETGMTVEVEESALEGEGEGGEEGAGEGEEGAEGGEGNEGEGGEEGANEGEDGEQNAGSKSGSRSSHIPRERFDAVNTKLSDAEAKNARYDRLKEMGLLTEGEDGEIHVNQAAFKREGGETKPDVVADFKFTKDEVSEETWPLVEKINKGFDHYEDLSNRLIFALASVRSENAVLRDFPEFRTKDGPLRKKTLEIMKSDPEFRKMYRGKPDAGYWAVKRASEALKGIAPTKPKPKKKPSFIVNKGDGGGRVKKTINLETATPAELDQLEKEEYNKSQRGKK